MPSTSNASLLAVAMLALYVTGSPIAETSGDAPEAELPSDSLSSSALWGLITDVIKPHEKQFEDEVKDEAKYHFLEHYEIPKPEHGCPASFSKESCFLSVAQGLYKYTVLLKHAEKELSNISIPGNAKHHADCLIQRVKEGMKHPERAVELTTSEQEQLLKQLENPNDFQRRMTAHNVLRQLHLFLIDGHRAVRSKERQRVRTTEH